MDLLDMAVGKNRALSPSVFAFFRDFSFCPFFRFLGRGGRFGGFLYWKRTKIILFLSIRLLVVLRETFPCFPCKSAFAELIAQYFKPLESF